MRCAMRKMCILFEVKCPHRYTLQSLTNVLFFMEFFLLLLSFLFSLELLSSDFVVFIWVWWLCAKDIYILSNHYTHLNGIWPMRSERIRGLKSLASIVFAVDVVVCSIATETHKEEQASYQIPSIFFLAVSHFILCWIESQVHTGRLVEFEKIVFDANVTWARAHTHTCRSSFKLDNDEACESRFTHTHTIQNNGIVCDSNTLGNNKFTHDNYMVVVVVFIAPQPIWCGKKSKKK